MLNVVYLIEQPLDDRNFNRFGIQAWLDRKWEVEVWDLTQLSFPKTWNSFIDSESRFANFESNFHIGSIGELRSRATNCGSVECFIDFTGWNFGTVYAKFLLKRAGAKSIFLANGTLPDAEPRHAISTRNRLITLIKKLASKSIALSLFYKISKFFFRPDYFVIAGGQSGLVSDGAKVQIAAHDFDYDIYMSLRNTSNSSTLMNVCVFIDQNLCFHSDFLAENTEFPVTPEKYFPSMREAFRKVADTWDATIFVAAHPRASYRNERINDCYGAEIKCGMTGELIRNCSMVICHYSTAVKFAVLFEKPILFFTTNEMNNAGLGRYVARIAQDLGKAVINIDTDLNKIDWGAELVVDYAKYCNFKNRYIKVVGSPEKPLWEIVIERVESHILDRKYSLV